MKTKNLGPILAVTIVAGLLTAFSAARQNNSRAEVLLQTANQERAEYRDHASGAATARAILKGDEDQLELFGDPRLLLRGGQTASAQSCPMRHCLSDATFVGCCGRLRVWGFDRLGACSVFERCPE
jgi:hypothetical protein